MKLRIKCKKCGVELTSSTKSMVCGCENMTSLHDDIVSAKNLSEVQIIEQSEEQTDELGGTRLAQREMNDWQLARSQRKIRHQNFEER